MVIEEIQGERHANFSHDAVRKKLEALKNVRPLCIKFHREDDPTGTVYHHYWKAPPVLPAYHNHAPAHHIHPPTWTQQELIRNATTMYCDEQHPSTHRCVQLKKKLTLITQPRHWPGDFGRQRFPCCHHYHLHSATIIPRLATCRSNRSLSSFISEARAQVARDTEELFPTR